MTPENGDSSEPTRNKVGAVGADLESELRDVITYGVAEAFPRLGQLRGLRYYMQHAPDDSVAGGTKVLRQLLRLAAMEFDPGPRTGAITALLSLDREGKGKRPLNGPDGLREAAGKFYKIGWDQFSRTKEDDLICHFAAWVRLWDLAQRPPPGAMLRLDWEVVEHVADRMYRLLEREFAPDLVVTMAGPGSFAAIYTMRLNPRDVPVLVAVTFPFRDSAGSAEHLFRSVAASIGWTGIRTSKWSVYIPDLVLAYPAGSRVVLLDDRVLTGETQALLHELLSDRSLDVRCAALFAPKNSLVKDLLVGQYVEGPFEMPWGSSRGRT